MRLGQMMLILPIVLVMCRGMSADGEGTDDCYCPEVVFLQYGRDGVVHCLCNSFDYVSWYLTEDYESEQPPLVTVDTVNKHGEYGIDMTGSLTINNVTLGHDAEYTVTFLQDDDRRTVTEAVRVEVVVQPVPEYPVVEGHFHHRHVYLQVERNGVIHCSMTGVHPLVNLTWKMGDQSACHKVHFVHHTTESTLNKNGTYNVVLTSQYQAETFTETCNIKCQIDGPISECFQWNQTTVELNFHTAEINQCHCSETVYLEPDKGGIIPCYCDSFNVVSWYTKEDLDSRQRPFIYFDNAQKRGPGHTSGEYDIGSNGSLIITNVGLWLAKKFVVRYLRHDVGRIDTQNVSAIVIVLPEPSYPIVNGFSHQQLIYMEAERNGKLTCSMKRVHPNVNLMWEIIDPSNSSKMDIYNNIVSFPNEDGTFNVTLTSLYKANLFERMSVIQCKVTSQPSKYFSSVVTVGLLYPPVPAIPPVPVIDGCYSQPDNCVLKVERTGDLTCTVKNSPYLIDLKWNMLRDTSQSTFKQNLVSQNKSTSFDVSSILSYSAADSTSTMLTVQCEMRNVADGPLLATKTVSLLLRAADDGNSLDEKIVKLTRAELALVIMFFALTFLCFAVGIFQRLKES